MVDELEKDIDDFNKEDYLVAFQIIATAGVAKSYAIEAVENAKIFNFVKAEELLSKSVKKYNECHGIQTKLLTQEARGIKNDINIIMVHAQDHLTMANMAYDNAIQFIALYKMIFELRKEGSKND